MYLFICVADWSVIFCLGYFDGNILLLGYLVRDILLCQSVKNIIYIKKIFFVDTHSKN